MNTYQLTPTTPFLDPRWMNRVRGRTFDCVVDGNYRIDLKGEPLRFRDHNHGFQPGDAVRVWLGHTFTCELLTDYQARLEAEKARRLQEEEQERLQCNRRRRDTENFNAALNIPVAWRTGYKDVLSGLSANSWGDGTNRATVGHIELLEDFAEGRLKRSKGDFLCTRDRGKQWSGDSHLYSIDGDGNNYNARVTCKACLKSAKRWSTP